MKNDLDEFAFADIKAKIDAELAKLPDDMKLIANIETTEEGYVLTMNRVKKESENNE